MIELARYIYKKYPGLRDEIQLWQLLSLLDKNEDKVIIVKGGDKFKGSALYARISDEVLWKLEFGFLDLHNADDVLTILNDKGRNIHFLYVLADDYKTIRKGLKEVVEKENPKTVSWFNPEMTQFNKFDLKGKVRLCLR